MKARNHERCSVGIYGWLREQKQESRRYAFVPFVSNIELSNQVPACHGASRFRHQVGVAQDMVDREPSRGQVQHGGGVSICWPTWPSSSRRTPFVVPRVSLLGICWPERSNGSTRRPQPPWIPTSCIPPGCNKCKCKCTACDSARACPVLPRLFFARLFHACAD
jgi:hypothetical protein